MLLLLLLLVPPLRPLRLLPLPLLLPCPLPLLFNTSIIDRGHDDHNGGNEACVGDRGSVVIMQTKVMMVFDYDCDDGAMCVVDDISCCRC